jgi:RNA polymerase sigma factor (sigma-70 family)
VVAVRLEISGELPAPLPRQRLTDLVVMAQRGDRRARDLVIKHTSRFVAGRVRRWRYLFPEHEEDAFAIGLEGINRAIETFDAERGLTFLTYAKPWVDQRVRTLGRRVSTLIHLGTNRPDSDAAAQRSSLLYLDAAPTTGDADGDHHGLVPAVQVLADAQLASHEDRQHVRALVAKLPAQQRRIIELRYFEIPRLTLEEVAARIGKNTRERVRQIESMALENLARLAGSQASLGEIYGLLRLNFKNEPKGASAGIQSVAPPGFEGWVKEAWAATEVEVAASEGRFCQWGCGRPAVAHPQPEWGQPFPLCCGRSEDCCLCFEHWSIAALLLRIRDLEQQVVERRAQIEEYRAEIGFRRRLFSGEAKPGDPR